MMDRFKIKLLITFIVLFFISSVSFALPIAGHSLNYYYELNYDKNSNVKLKKRQPNKDIVNISNISSKPVKKKRKSKRTLLENLDNNAPKTFEEYLLMSKEIKRSQLTYQEPTFEKDPKIIDLPEPNIRIVKYNNPPGTPDLNLNNLISNANVNSIAVLSPDQSKLVYSVANFSPSQNTVSSQMYLINLNNGNSIKEKLKQANAAQRVREPLLSSGEFELTRSQFKTLVLVDWSVDGKKIAVKEKVGSVEDGVWQTNLWVYDFDTKQKIQLNAIREAIRYWWKTNQNKDLAEYMWDIYPVGWDANSPERIIVYAYAYTKKSPMFLGTWSIDAKGDRSELLSLDKTNFPISVNGLALKMIVRE